MTNADYFKSLIKGKKKNQIDEIRCAIFNGPAEWDNENYQWLDGFEHKQYRETKIAFICCPRAVNNAIRNLKAESQFWWFNEEYDGKWDVQHEKLPKDLAILSVLRNFVGA